MKGGNPFEGSHKILGTRYIERNMVDKFCVDKKSRCKIAHITMLHHHRVGLFINVIEILLQKLNNRFN